MSSRLLTWSIRLIPLVLLFLYYSHVLLQSYVGVKKSVNPNTSMCKNNKKWESDEFNVTRKTSLFLKLKDFFWDPPESTLPLPYGTKGSEELLLKVLRVTNGYEMPASVDGMACRSCVVIGNGFALKNSSLGKSINNYDVVIRLNDAPVRGYEDDVGSKTTLRFFYPESASHDPSVHNQDHTLMVLVPFKQNDLRWLKEILYNEKRVRKGFWKLPPQIWLGKARHVRILDPVFLQETATHLLGMTLRTKADPKAVHPTTGILAVYVALSYCDVVHVAGFGYPQHRDQKQPIHYYGSDTMKSMKDSYHNLSHEAVALRRLEDSGAILYLHTHS